jgi:hypothetical protein
MFGSAVLYSGLIVAVMGLVLTLKPMERLRVPTRRRALTVVAAGTLLSAGALSAPAFEARIPAASTRLDEFAPVWQFHEVHTLRVHAPPERVFDAIKQVRAVEILLFRTLTWMRRGGRPAPANILNPGSREPIVTVATKGGFVILAEEAPRELVLGAIVAAPRGPRERLTSAAFREPFPPGYALAAMNFLVTPDGPASSIVSTETRVFANSPEARRQFAAYWRAIYPGSALIRRMWLRAIDRRATSSDHAAAR